MSKIINVVLTPAEFRLLPFLQTHLTFKEIGVELFISHNTIRTQSMSIYRKFQVHTRSDAVKHAIEIGLLPKNNLEEAHDLSC